MKLEKSYGLTQNHLEDIKLLETQCNRFEGLTMKLNWSTLQSRPTDALNDFLYYNDQILIGYLALYGFNNREVEISAMVAPKYRRQGIFNHLLAAARQEIKRRDVPDMLFICEVASKSGAACMQAIGATYEFSEYRMDLHHSPKLLPMPANLRLRPAQPEDLPLMTQLDGLCFQVTADQNSERLQRQIEDPARKMLIITLNHNNIGKIYTLVNREETYISAFCIVPKYRGKGYGKAVLSQVITELVAEGRQNITLEVETKNENALALYKHCGFETRTGYNYYRMQA